MAYGQLRAEDCLLNGAFEIKLMPPKFAVLASPVVDLHREVAVYDAPELQGQARVSSAALFASDMWALGMLSAVLMCGTAAILNPSVIQSSLLASDDKDSCASAAATLRELLSRMLAAAPQERPGMKAGGQRDTPLLRTGATKAGDRVRVHPQRPELHKAVVEGRERQVVE